MTFQTMHLPQWSWQCAIDLYFWTPLLLLIHFWKEFRPCLTEVKVTYASYMLLKACKAFSDPLLEVMYLGKNALKLSHSTILYTIFFVHYQIVLK
jgi:hypothetical protein